MKLIIAGGRHFTHFEGALAFYKQFIGDTEIEEIISGGAKGADTVGERIAAVNRMPVVQFIPEWDKLGKSAGYIRNSDMADYGDMLLAFWDGESKGTKHMIDLATKKGLKVKVVRYTVRYEDAEI